MIKTLPGIFSDVCYCPFPCIVTIENDYKTVRYRNLLTNDNFRTLISDNQLLFPRVASRITEIRLVAQAVVSEHVNKLAIIHGDGTLAITEHNCSGQEGCYIEVRDGKFIIYNKIGSWNYIILQEDGSFTTHDIPYPEGTVQGIIDVLPDETIFWGEERTRKVGDLTLVYPIFRAGVTFGQEFSKVDRLSGVDIRNHINNINFLALDNKLGKYPHLATDGYSNFLSTWAELGGTIGYEFYPPFPPYTPPVELPDVPEIIRIPDFQRANHFMNLMIPGSPSGTKRLTWIGDPNENDPNVVAVFFTRQREDKDTALAICKRINKPLCFHNDSDDFPSVLDTECKLIEDVLGITVWRSWNAYPVLGKNIVAQSEKILREVSGKKAPWLAFYRQIKQVEPVPIYHLSLDLVVKTLGELWELFRNDKSIVGLNGFTYDRANGKDGIIAWKELAECEKLMRANIPAEVIVVIPPPIVIVPPPPPKPRKRSFWEKLADLFKGKKWNS